jgi:hypothetical protein
LPRKKMMKAKVVTLVAAIAFSVGPMFAQSKFQIAEVNQILTNPDGYRGKVVALHGIIENVDPAQKIFTVVDSKSDSSAGGANRRSLPATIQGGSAVDTPKPGQEAIVIGQIGNKDNTANFAATQVFTNRTDVQQILAQGSIGRRTGKRPGDNLGRDTQARE